MKTEASVIRSTENESAKGKILLVIGDATEVIDTLYPWMRLQEDEYQVVLAAPEVRTYSMVQHQRPEGWDITRETPGYLIDADLAFADIRPDEYAGLLVSGGRAPEYLRYDAHLIDAVQWMAKEARPIGSVCHGIEVLATAGVITGKRITTVPKCQFDLEVCGGVFVDEPCVVDGNLISGRTYHDSGHFVGKWIALLEEARAAATG